MAERISLFARRLSAFVSSPGATGAAFALVIVWALCGPVFHYSNRWQFAINETTTIVTFLMIFVLNNAQARDTSAINGKLDALIFAARDADNRLIGMENRAVSHESTAIVEEIQQAADTDPQLKPGRN